MFKKSFTFEIGLNILCCLKSPNTSFKLKRRRRNNLFFYFFVIWKIILKTSICLNRVSNKLILHLYEISLTVQKMGRVHMLIDKH